MDHKKEIINTIQSISGRYSSYEIFSDWIRCAALSISNTVNMVHDKVWKDREKDYIATMQKYTEDERLVLCKLTGMLTLALEDDLEDILGYVFMHSDMGSSKAGQFFTPFHLSELTARMALLPDDIKGNGMITIAEPSCGGGGMIIAACKILKDKGINFQRRLDVVAQDLDWRSVYMTYLQLSLIGCRAIVVQGDTLCDPFDPERTPRERMLYTPAKLGALI